MHEVYEYIAEHLHELSAVQLNDISARIAMLVGSKQVGGDRSVLYDGESAENEVWDAIQHVMYVMYRQGRLPRSIATKQRYWSQFKAGAQITQRFVDESGITNKVMRVQMLRLCIQSLCAYLEDGSIPVSYKSVCTALSQVPTAVDQQFPGYARSKLLPLILKKAAKA